MKQLSKIAAIKEHKPSSAINLYRPSFFVNLIAELPLFLIVLAIGLYSISSKAALGEDPYASEQWGLKNSCQPRVIELDHSLNRILPIPGDRPLNDINLPNPISAKRKIRVAVLDTGIQKDHPDLAANIVHNESECKALEKFKACLKCDDDPSLSCANNKREKCEKIWYDVNHPEVDLDKNGYPLDCSGWSTLGSNSKDTSNPNKVSGILGRPDFDDVQGHGTHISGIIAAVSHNGEGLKGCSDNVEILPVQVLTAGPQGPVKPLTWSIEPKEPTERKDKRPTQNLGDFIARGVYYAIHSKADVINLSLGWPQREDSELLREAIVEAQKRGIIIIAAAGNDSTKALLRPCAYPGVICVGSHDPDGAISHFSNYGPGVDFFAPGLDILSTWPKTVKPQRFRKFAAQKYLNGNYEILHGSSQATAFGSCAAAELLARGIPANEVYPRLLLGTREVQKPVEIISVNPHENVDAPLCGAVKERKVLYKKFGVSGLLDISRSLKVKSQPLILPAQKESTLLTWDRKSSELSLAIDLKNYYQTTEQKVSFSVSPVREHAKAIRPQVRIVSISGEKSKWSSGETRKLNLNLVIDDALKPENSRIPSEFEVLVEVYLGEKFHRSFKVPVEIVVPVHMLEENQGAFSFSLANQPAGRFQWIPLDHVLDGRPEFMDYLLWQRTKDEWTYHLMSQNRNGNPRFQAYDLMGSSSDVKPWDIKGKLVDDYSRLDVDFDGSSEYVFMLIDDRSQLRIPEPSPVKFLIFDEKMNLKSEIEYDSQLSQIPYNVSLQIQWMAYNGQKVPTWVGFGQNPEKVHTLRDVWKNRNLEKKNHFWERPQVRMYYLTHSGELKVLPDHEEYAVADMLAPSQLQIDEGRIPVLMAKAEGTDLKPSYIVNFATAEVFNGKIINFKRIAAFDESKRYRNLLDTRVDYSFNLSSGQDLYNGTFWFKGGKTKHIHISLLTLSEELFDGQIGALRGEVDSALAARYAFMGKEGPSTFILTNSEIQFHELSSNGQSAHTSLRRYTFYTDLVFETFNFPFMISSLKKNQEMIPTLYTTEGSGLNKGIRFSVPQYEGGELIELSAPARLRLTVGFGCEPIDQPFWAGANYGTFLDFRCRDKIVRFPLNY